MEERQPAIDEFEEALLKKAELQTLKILPAYRGTKHAIIIVGFLLCFIAPFLLSETGFFIAMGMGVAQLIYLVPAYFFAEDKIVKRGIVAGGIQFFTAHLISGIVLFGACMWIVSGIHIY